MQSTNFSISSLFVFKKFSIFYLVSIDKWFKTGENSNFIKFSINFQFPLKLYLLLKGRPFLGPTTDFLLYKILSLVIFVLFSA